jgi:signal transduction histidine kinase/CheY-like chemotaxis protein
MGSTRPLHVASAKSGEPLAGGTPGEGSRGRSLRARLVLIVAGVCVAVWVSTLFDTLRDRDETLALAERQHDNVAGALAEQAARALQATDLILRQAALLDPDSASAPRDRAAIPDLLRRHMSGVPQVRNLFLFDPARGLHLTSAPASAATRDLSDRSYFTTQRDRPDLGLFVSEPFISRVTGEPTFVLSRRLPGAQFHGIVGAAVDVPYLRHFYQALDLGSGSTVELLRTDGTRLVNREHSLTEGLAPAWLAAPRALGSAQAVHTILLHPDLGRVRISLRRVPGYPALIALGRSEAAILAVWRAKAWKIALRTFVITTLAALLLFAFLRELARHERVTAQLHQSQKLEALGTLAGGIAHDFNNVLGAVLGYGELAIQHAPAGSAQRRYLDNIVVAANRARELVARILAFSRPGLGRPRPVSLQRLLGEVRELTCATLPPDVVLELSVPPIPLVASGDPSQLHQMLVNLASNAVQAVSGGGRVVLRATAAEVTEARDCSVGRLQRGHYARIDVCDSGQGMTSEQLERIFEPFFTTKPLGAGTGLGLSLVHGIVLDHGAALEIESLPGAGTTFTVYLPLSDRQAVPEPEPVPAQTGNGETILVVDDEERLVHLAEEVLAGLGYEPVGCAGASAALRLFRAAPQRFDVVLTDAIMPQMSGTELLAEIRRLRPELPGILLSGYGGPDLQEQARSVGAHAILTKPLTAAELAQCLADVLAHARTVKQAGFAA